MHSEYQFGKISITSKQWMLQYQCFRIKSTHISYNNPTCRFVSASDLICRRFRHRSSLSRACFWPFAYKNVVKYLSHLHKQFISPIPLVQFYWYHERKGDNDETLTWTSDLINLFFPKDIYRHSFFFFSRFTRKLANVFEKNEKKNKTYLCTSYINFFYWFMAQALLQ